MKTKLFAGVLLCVFGVAVACLGVADKPPAERRAAARKAYDAGNYNDAYKVFAALAADPENDPTLAPSDLELAVQSLRNLARNDEIDEFRETVVKAHPKNWRLLWAAARTLNQGDNYGFVVAGKFYRGGRRGNDGKQVMAVERDRVRAMQLMTQAADLAAADADKGGAADFYYSFAEILLDSRYGDGAWRLQYLTDLATLPDYEEGQRYWYGRPTRGAPVDENGDPVFHTVPKSWADAKTDGQRWRWCLTQCAELESNHGPQARHALAQFLRGQFDVQTMAQFGYRFGFAGYEDDAPAGLPGPENGNQDKQSPQKSGPFAVSTLGEDETIAKLATGIKRFKLPDEFNFIKIFQDLSKANDTWGQIGLDNLAQIFTDRQQYPKAAEYWKQSIARFGDPHAYKTKARDQIVGNWGRFDPTSSAPAGEEPTVGFIFRNASKVTFTAHEINVRLLLGDVKTYLKRRDNGQLDWEQMEVSNVGYRLIEKGQAKYLGAQAAQWDLALEPRESHFDKRITVKTPLKKAGAYLLTAKMADGNETRVVVWVADTVIVKKPLDGGTWCYVADAKTGKPIAKANVEFFGYRQEHLGQNRYKTETNQFAEFTDGGGQIRFSGENRRNEFSYFITATTADGRFAYHGFTGLWYGRWYDHEYNTTKAFGVTDRPVYRPGQSVKFKFWVGQAKYDQPKQGKSPHAGQQFTVVINNPKGDKILEQQMTADDFGGFAGELALGSDATLGVYSAHVPGMGDVSFRVEEYKKPEFEVKVDAPVEPVALGDKITATITAKYYFGAPVTEAKVKYKVVRTEADATWFPATKWDWFYGPGYWWFGYDYDWYPGFRDWGCCRPYPWWIGFSPQQPEVVMENEVPVGPDGTVKVEIDSSVAKAMHGDHDHRYTVTAEVTDNSRRTIVGQGAVSAARQPFKVYAWVDRGYYQSGDVINADFAARTLDGKPIGSAKGKLKLIKIGYDEKMKPIEREVGAWDVGTNPEGRATHQIKAAQAGQYRLSYSVTDAKNRSIEGGYVFVVRGEGFRGEQFRFNDIELVADKKEYQPGDKVRLMVNANRANSTVVLFVRPSNGVYLPPKIIRLDGKSTVEEIDVGVKDMPNFFVEAFTVGDADVFSQAREIIVPPEGRALNVEVLPNKTGYKPGEKASVKLRLTDEHGEPVVGSAVVSVYDKSVEYISGGSNVQDIKSFFWKWRRHHRPNGEDSLKGSSPLPRSGEIAMGHLGVFGHMVGDLALGDRDQFAYAKEKKDGFRQERMFEGRMAAKSAMAAAPGAAMDAAGSAGPAAENEFDASGGQPGQPLVEPTVRKNFADSALWVASIVTGRDGTAVVNLDMPENLTTWKTRVWSLSGGTRVGQGEAEVVTAKDLLVRMQAPRFFVQKDEVVLSANVHNYLDAAKRVKVTLETDGGYLSPIGGNGVQWVQVAPKGEARVDWRVKVNAPGTAVVRMKAQTDTESDAMQLSFPVYIHGMLKTDSYSGALRPNESNASLTIRVPRERLPEQSRIEVRYSPSVAASMVDALPYLVDFPYGCTEQTLNRFVPTVITQRTLLAMGLDLKAIRDKRTNLNAQEIGDDAKRAQDWKRNNPPNPGAGERNPVFDEAVVAAMVKEGVTALTNMQLSDGGWGWFSGYGEHSDPHTTAVVVHGLQLARANDVALVPGVLERGTDWLKNWQAARVKELQAFPNHSAWDLDAFIFMVLTDAGHRDDSMSDFLYRDRNGLSAYSKAACGLAFHKLNEREKLQMILKNLSQFLVRDDENQTAYLRLPEGNSWWYWYGSDTEANAFYLKLLAITDPRGETAPALAKYLINNRKHATYWNSTRDTAYCIEALAEYVKASGEDKPDLTVAVLLDGKKVKDVKINRENLFTFDNAFVLAGTDVTAGDHTIEFVKQGNGPLYYNAYVTNFTLEDPIKRAGLEVKVDRKFYRLVPVKGATAKVAGSRGQAIDQKVEKYERRPIKDGDTLTSGDLVEVELEIDSKNDYEYLLFEDMKAAGFEPVDVRSGYNGNDLNAYMELRDERVCFFARTLARGKHSVSYRLRAEIPGKFSALPTRASAMYAPELKANSDESKLAIQDAPATPPTARGE